MTKAKDNDQVKDAAAPGPIVSPELPVEAPPGFREMTEVERLRFEAAYNAEKMHQNAVAQWRAEQDNAAAREQIAAGHQASAAAQVRKALGDMGVSDPKSDIQVGRNGRLFVRLPGPRAVPAADGGPEATDTPVAKVTVTPGPKPKE